MDKEAPEVKTCEDVTRESLIALSYSVPDQPLPSEMETFNTENPIEGINHDGTEKYMSDLISISDVPSPEAKTLPAAVKEPEP